MTKRIAIIGASGYSGAELLRLLALHPEFEVSAATANSAAGQEIGVLYPHLSASYPNLRCQSLEEAAGDLATCDLAFLALPHGESMGVVASGSALPEKLVDLGSDFRIRDAATQNKWYGREHCCPVQLGSWSYGLPELFRESIRASKWVASPGCYPTAVSLAIAPLLRAGLVEPQIVADCVSGTSGAGKSLKAEMHYSHADENVYAYKIGAHPHTAEIEQTLSDVSGGKVVVSFTPHVVPMTRGIHATVSAPLTAGVDSTRLQACLEAAYVKEPFVSVLPAPPSVKDVRGSNCARVFGVADQRVGRAVVTCVIDNLVKGAAGQAIQNANLLFGFNEVCGLPMSGLYP